MESNNMNEQSSNQAKSKKKNEVGEPPVRNEIPMYDPQTGEPNPLYEELTGKKNPLTIIRNQQGDGKILPLQYEPKRKNRWLVTFPKEFGIPQWVFSKTQRPSVKVVSKKFLGIFNIGVELKWEKISFEFNDPIGPSTSQALAKIIEEKMYGVFDYKLEMLDPTGAVIETWNIKDCEIEAISLGALEYGEDGIMKCFMLINPGSATLLK